MSAGENEGALEPPQQIPPLQFTPSVRASINSLGLQSVLWTAWTGQPWMWIKFQFNWTATSHKVSASQYKWRGLKRFIDTSTGRHCSKHYVFPSIVYSMAKKKNRLSEMTASKMSHFVYPFQKNIRILYSRNRLSEMLVSITDQGRIDLSRFLAAIE